MTQDLRTAVVSPDTLMHNFLLLREDSRKTGPYVDPRYVPVYYYLGKYLKPKTLVEVGFRLGLFSAAFFKGCDTVERFFAFQPESEAYYSPRLASRNVRFNYRGAIDFYKGKIIDAGFRECFAKGPWDLAFLNEEAAYDVHREYLDTLWEGIALGGYVVSDYVKSHQPAGTAFRDFCKTKNREPVYLTTRYGVGLVQK
jgi:hypothetical protein